MDMFIQAGAPWSPSTTAPEPASRMAYPPSPDTAHLPAQLRCLLRGPADQRHARPLFGRRRLLFPHSPTSCSWSATRRRCSSLAGTSSRPSPASRSPRTARRRRRPRRNSGVAHFAYDDEETCLEEVRYLLSLLLSNNRERPPPSTATTRSTAAASISSTSSRRTAPAPTTCAPSMRRSPTTASTWMSTNAGPPTSSARSQASTRPGRRHHRHQPQTLAGVLDIHASEKAARFVTMRDSFTIPLVTLLDAPRLPPRRQPGTRPHHPPRRDAAVGLLRGGVVRSCPPRSPVPGPTAGVREGPARVWRAVMNLLDFFTRSVPFSGRNR
jgi:hypothetical protein